MISYIKHKDPARMMKMAVLDDKTPAPKGEVLEYWQGETDFDPEPTRKKVFQAVYDLYERGLIRLVQVRLGDGVYSYRGVVK